MVRRGAHAAAFGRGRRREFFIVGSGEATKKKLQNWKLEGVKNKSKGPETPET
jgi:hypothetical protein